MVIAFLILRVTVTVVIHEGVCDHEVKARGQNPSVGLGTTIFKFVVNIFVD